MVHYGNVQKKVNDKYDMWHKEVLTRFGGMLGQSMQDFHTAVTKVGTGRGLADVVQWCMFDQCSGWQQMAVEGISH